MAKGDLTDEELEDAEDAERKEKLGRIVARRKLRSAGEDELSEVIKREAKSFAEKPDSTPPRGRFFLKVLDRLSPGGRVIVVLATLVLFGVALWRLGPALLDRLQHLF